MASPLRQLAKTRLQERILLDPLSDFPFPRQKVNAE